LGALQRDSFTSSTDIDRLKGMLGLHAQELAIIAFIVVMLFGYKRIPQIFGGLGQGIRDFKKGLKDDSPEDPPLEASKVDTDQTQEKASTKT